MVSCTKDAVAGFFSGAAALCVDFQNKLQDFLLRVVVHKTKTIRGSTSMTRILFLILCLGFVAACDSGGGDVLQTPTGEDGTGGDGGTDGDGDEQPIVSDRGTPSLPPGTSNPTPNSQIVRREERDEESGGGYATNIRYLNDEGQDEFFVDNIAFDGNNVYTRGNPDTGVAQLGEFAVYEGAESTEDPVTGTTLRTFTYRAIYGRSINGETEFAIVRSGSYVDYGFGGFVYQRNGFDDDGNEVSLVLPEDGDAIYTGDYAGIRVFRGAGGLEYVQGDAEMIVDFKDFNEGNRGVALFVRNRRLYDINGTEITRQYLDALGRGDEAEDDVRSLLTDTDADGNPVLPTIRPVISPDDADSNGEIAADVFELAVFDNGETIESGEGTYYAIMSGDGAEEIVGVLVMEGNDPRHDSDVTYQETGGFIVYRQ
ncbi:MAG: hypothetical protein DCO97_07750 [Marivita sp. XM-24bin2]|nr:MAG: hypothetical protein DCO97_07750 [Marivita sp. XM-24bin2]